MSAVILLLQHQSALNFTAGMHVLSCLGSC